MVSWRSLENIKSTIIKKKPEATLNSDDCRAATSQHYVNLSRCGSHYGNSWIQL